MTYYPIRSFAMFIPLFTKVLSEGRAQNDVEELARVLLRSSGYLPIGRFIARHRRKLQPGMKAIPVLVYGVSEDGIVWVGMDKKSQHIGIGWVDFNAPLLVDYGGHDLGFVARPPRRFTSWRLLYRWLRRRTRLLHRPYLRPYFCAA